MEYIPVKIDKRKGPKPERVKRFCPKGHDKDIVGVDANSYCNQCKKEWESPLKNQFCHKGHDTFLTGRYKNGYCVVCKKEWYDQHIPAPKPQFCVNGHDTFICGREQRGRCKMCAKLCNQKRRTKENIRHKKRWISDISYKLKRTLRSRLREVLKDNKKRGSAIKNLGCSIESLKQYLESQFRNGMTWNNWGTIWELDHIVALWRFNLVDREQFLKAANYTNLQPLLAEEHKKKSSKDLKDFFAYKRKLIK